MLGGHCIFSLENFFQAFAIESNYFLIIGILKYLEIRQRKGVQE